MFGKDSQPLFSLEEPTHLTSLLLAGGELQHLARWPHFRSTCPSSKMLPCPRQAGLLPGVPRALAFPQQGCAPLGLQSPSTPPTPHLAQPLPPLLRKQETAWGSSLPTAQPPSPPLLTPLLGAELAPLAQCLSASQGLHSDRPVLPVSSNSSLQTGNPAPVQHLCCRR